MDKKKKRKIAIIIILFVIILLFFCFRNRGYFPVELYEYLNDKQYESGYITEEYLKENGLYDESFVCSVIYYSGNTIEFNNCVIEDKDENYCVFEDDELSCYYKDMESSFELTTKIPNLHYNSDQSFKFEYVENSIFKIESVNYCLTTDNICTPNLEYDNGYIDIKTESLTNKVCFQANYTDLTNSDIVCSENIVIDKTSPVIESLVSNGELLNDDWYNNLINIDEAVVTDNLTGIKDIKIEGTVKEGVNTILVTAIDNASNESSREFIVKVDTVKPNNGSIIIDGKLGLNGWYTSLVNISKINGSDLLSGYNKSILNYTSLSDSVGTNVILTTYDNAYNTNSTSLFIKVDTTKPTIHGIADLVIDMNTNIDLLEGVTATDSTSKVNGSVKIIENNLDVTKAGEYFVTYEAVDNAGNINTTTRKIVVESNIPEVLFKVDESIFTNNYSKENVMVDIEVIENNNDIRDILYCTTTSTCEPNLNLGIDNKVLLDTESDSNKVCIKVLYSSEVTVCSDIYKIDKTGPVINDLIIDGEEGNNGWYKSFIELETNGATDNLSGLKDINISKEEINYDTASEMVTITAIDNAGNITTKDIEFKIDTVLPVIGDYVVTGTKGFNDYYITDVNVSGLNAVDSLSGLESVVSNYDSFTFDTVGTDIIITAKDNAGNIATKRETIKIDKTAPVILNYDITEKDSDTDWHKTTVLIDNIIATDNISGVNQSTVVNLEYTIDYETVGEFIEIQVDDLAGNRYTERIKVKVDLTPPLSGNIILDGVLGSNGWYNSDVTITTTEGTDNLSGIKSSEISMDFLTGVHLETTVYLTTTDNAGHEVDTSKDVKIDKIVPEVGTIVPSGTLGNDGWYISDVTIGKTDGNDSGSGHGSTTVDILGITENTVGTTVTITTTDQSGLKATYSEIFKVDKFTPTIVKNGDIVIEKGTDIDLTIKFTSTFGVSTGTTTCDVTDTSVLDVGVYDVTCTVTSVAGLSSFITTTFEVVQTYEAIEYIESYGGQYIETGLMNTGDYIFEDEFLITDLGVGNNTGSWIVGGRVNPSYSLGVFVNNSQVIAAYGSITKTLYPGIKEDVWYTMYFSRFQLTIGGRNYVVPGQLLIPEEYEAEIIIGGNLLAYDGVSVDNRNMRGQRKYFKITDANTGEVLRHYIPAELIETGEIGMWELIEGKFYGNDGTGEFTAS